MKLPLLSAVYPFTPRLAELHNGWSEGKYFKRAFHADTLQGQIDLINIFLNEQGFDIFLEANFFDNESLYEEGNFIFLRNLTGFNQIVLVYEQPVGLNSMDEMLKFLDFFRNARDWKKFHTSKNLSMAIGSEAGELIDLFLWDREKDVDEDKVKNELADIVTYCLYLASNFGIDLFDAVIDKTIENDKKYPVDKAKGSAKKYNKLM
jgi:NTP pyrophosphatase (non-canonical NTP hydrolase)